MSSDKRRTGGAANYEWNRGVKAEPVTHPDYIAAQVRRYLTDCKRFRHLIGPAHPTEEGALKIVFHAGDTQKQAVLSAFRQMTAPARAETEASGG